jgi:hypothetical protein
MEAVLQEVTQEHKLQHVETVDKSQPAIDPGAWHSHVLGTNHCRAGSISILCIRCWLVSAFKRYVDVRIAHCCMS